MEDIFPKHEIFLHVWGSNPRTFASKASTHPFCKTALKVTDFYLLLILSLANNGIYWNYLSGNYFSVTLNQEVRSGHWHLYLLQQLVSVVREVRRSESRRMGTAAVF